MTRSLDRSIPPAPLARAPQLVALAASDASVHPFVVQSLAARAQRGEPVGIVVGHNRFDLYAFTRLARQHGFDPTRWLTHIHLSRAFTCHQLRHRLVTLDRAVTRAWRALYVLGLLDTFYDEDIEYHEAARLLDETLDALKRLACEGLPVLITLSPPRQPGRERLVQSIARAVDDYWEPVQDPQDFLQMGPPNRAVQLGLPGCATAKETFGVFGGR